MIMHYLQTTSTASREYIER